METNKRTRGGRYLLYAIPVIIAIGVGLFLLLRSGPEKGIEMEAEKEAAQRIEDVREESTESIDVKRADHFISAETVLSKKDEKIILTTPKALLEDAGLEPRSEIKVLVQEEKTIITTPRELSRQGTIHPDTPIRILKEDGQVMETTPREILADPSITPDTPIKIIETVEKVIITTPEELQKTVPSPETPIRVVMEQPEGTLTLSELLPEEGLEEDTFYVHAVTPGDVQGIWGIIQHGLMDRFLEGIPVRTVGHPPKDRVLTLKIPEDADEPTADGHSSYFGTILKRKTEECYVYNYTNGRMGRNPDYIWPGQELVISRFSKKELVDIYRHFAENP
jgi:hypothetical protein